MYQLITIAGRVGREPEMKYTPTGVPVCSFSVAVDKVWTDSQGVKNEKTTWFRVTTWRKLAETCGNWVKKGNALLITGEIDCHGYTDRDGVIQASLDLTASMVKFLPSGAGKDGQGGAKPTAAMDATGSGGSGGDGRHWSMDETGSGGSGGDLWGAGSGNGEALTVEDLPF